MNQQGHEHERHDVIVGDRLFQNLELAILLERLGDVGAAGGDALGHEVLDHDRASTRADPRSHRASNDVAFSIDWMRVSARPSSAAVNRLDDGASADSPGTSSARAIAAISRPMPKTSTVPTLYSRCLAATKACNRSRPSRARSLSSRTRSASWRACTKAFLGGVPIVGLRDSNEPESEPSTCTLNQFSIELVMKPSATRKIQDGGKIETARKARTRRCPQMRAEHVPAPLEYQPEKVPRHQEHQQQSRMMLRLISRKKMTLLPSELLLENCGSRSRRRRTAALRAPRDRIMSPSRRRWRSPEPRRPRAGRQVLGRVRHRVIVSAPLSAGRGTTAVRAAHSRGGRWRAARRPSTHLIET